MTSRLIPLDELRFGHEADPPINARKVGRDDGIADLAASIAAHGLITPLKVKVIKQVPYVAVGNRRLAAMRLLVEQGAGLPTVSPVRCEEIILVTEAAREMALAEQIMRAPLHEADQYEEFRTLADGDLSEAEIAIRFGIEPKRVKRILALGRLSPMVLEWWRNEERGPRTFETVCAFTLAESIEEQEKLFKKLSKQKNIHSHAVRMALGAGDQETAKYIKIAGLQAYKAAGGEVTADLFGDNHVIKDKKLAKRVADDKIKATLDALKAEGWSWTSLASDLPYNWTYSWNRAKPSEGKATADEKKRQKKLSKAGAKGDDAAIAELAELQKAIAARQWTPDQLAAGGAVLTVGYHGDLDIVRGVMKPGKAKPAKPSKSKTEGGETAAPSISNAMATRLSAQAGLATRRALQEEPRIGLVALLAGFLTKRSMYDGARVSPIRVSHEGMGHQKLRGTETFGAAFERLRKMTDADLFRVAAGIAGNAVSLHVGDSAMKGFDGAPAVLAAAINTERMAAAMREAFDPVDYFGGVSKPFKLRAITEALNEDEARKAGKLKADELTAFAIANVVPTGWLPPELRCPTYTGPGAIPEFAPAPDLGPGDDEDDDFDASADDAQREDELEEEAA